MDASIWRQALAELTAPAGWIGPMRAGVTAQRAESGLSRLEADLCIGHSYAPDPLTQGRPLARYEARNMRTAVLTVALGSALLQWAATAHERGIVAAVQAALQSPRGLRLWPDAVSGGHAPSVRFLIERLPRIATRLDAKFGTSFGEVLSMFPLQPAGMKQDQLAVELWGRVWTALAALIWIDVLVQRHKLFDAELTVRALWAGDLDGIYMPDGPLPAGHKSLKFMLQTNVAIAQVIHGTGEPGPPEHRDAEEDEQVKLRMHRLDYYETGTNREWHGRNLLHVYLAVLIEVAEAFLRQHEAVQAIVNRQPPHGNA